MQYFKKPVTYVADKLAMSLDAVFAVIVVMFLFGLRPEGAFGDLVNTFIGIYFGYNLYGFLLPYRTFPDDEEKPDEIP